MAARRYDQLAQVMRSPAVKAKQAQVADAIASRGQALAEAEGVDARIRRESGVRPQGRPYERVLADAAQEHGTAKVTRRRILARAARQR